MASSPLPGWRSQGTALGSGAVIMPDQNAVAKEWSKSLGRKPTKKDRDAWLNHASRQGLGPDDIAKEWTRFQTEARLATTRSLADIFSESLFNWKGMNVPLKQMLDPQNAALAQEPNMDPATVNDPPLKKKKRRPQMEIAPPSATFPKMTQASQGQVPSGQKYPDDVKPPGFPFSTKAAGVVWAAAQKLMRDNPEIAPQDILGQAMQQVKTPIYDLTPEDLTLLQMALQFAQNGPARNNVRAGGTPNDGSDATGP